jgi:transcriptional regulator with XRE-family HTH domain
LTLWWRFATLAAVTPDELRRKRERLGMTQAELAKRLGVTKSTVLRYENGRITIPKMLDMAIRDLERETK